MVLDKLSPDINQLAYMSESLKASSSLVEKSIDSLSDLPSPMDSDSDSLQKLRVELENSRQSQADVSKALLSGLQDVTQKLDAAIKRIESTCASSTPSGSPTSLPHPPSSYRNTLLNTSASGHGQNLIDPKVAR